MWYSLYPVQCLCSLIFRYLSIYHGNSIMVYILNFRNVTKKRGIYIYIYIYISRRFELNWYARPFSGSRYVISVYIREWWRCRRNFTRERSFVTSNNLRRGDSVRLCGEAVCIRLHISHVVYVPPYLHRGLVISLKYNRPRDRHLSYCCLLVCSRVAYCRSSSPVGDVESRMGMRGCSWS